VIRLKNSDEKFFSLSGAEKVDLKVHHFTPGGVWLELNKIRGNSVTAPIHFESHTQTHTHY